MSDLSIRETPFLQEDKALNADTPIYFSRGGGIHEIDSRMHPGIELEAKKTPGEMSSNEEVGHELAVSKSQISELP